MTGHLEALGERETWLRFCSAVLGLTNYFRVVRDSGLIREWKCESVGSESQIGRTDVQPMLVFEIPMRPGQSFSLPHPPLPRLLVRAGLAKIQGGLE